MNMKKLVSSVAAFALTASAFAGLAVTASADVTVGANEHIDEVLIGTKSADGTSVAAEDFESETATVAAWSNKSNFSIVDEVPTDVWNSLALEMSGKTMRLGSRTTHQLDFAETKTSGKVVFASNFYVGTHAKTIQIIGANDEVVAQFAFPDKSASNGRVYQQQYLSSGAYTDATIAGTYVMNDTYLGTRNREYQITELVIDLDNDIVSYTGKIMDRRSSTNKWCDDSATITYSSDNQISGVKGVRIDASACGSSTYYAYFDNMKLYNIAPNSTMYDYTINYTYNGTTVYTGKGSAAENEVVKAEQSVYGKTDNQKYYTIVQEDETLPSITISANAENNVIDVPVRMAEVYNVSIKSSVSDTVINTGTAVEGDSSEALAYPKYELVGTTLYGADALDDGGKRYSYTFTNATKDTTEKYIEYTDANAGTIVYYSEAEDINGLTELTKGSNVFARSSNQKAAYAAEDTVITTLPAGKYKVHMAYYSNSSAGVTLKFALGNNNFEAKHEGASNSVSYDSEEIVITDESDLTFLASGTVADGLDYIYVEKTGDVEPTPVEKTLPEVAVAEAATYDNPGSNPAKAYTGTFTVGENNYSVNGVKWTATIGEKSGDATSTFDTTITNTTVVTGLVVSAESLEGITVTAECVPATAAE